MKVMATQSPVATRLLPMRQAARKEGLRDFTTWPFRSRRRPGRGQARRPRIVSIAEFLFGPEKTVVQKGGTINWTNIDDSPHQVTVSPGAGASELRTPVLLKGQTDGFRFDHVGTYSYICGLHPGMKGVIEVS